MAITRSSRTHAATTSAAAASRRITNPSPGALRRAAAVGVLLSVTGVGLAGCTIPTRADNAAAAQQSAAPSTSVNPADLITITSNKANGATDVDIIEPVTITASSRLNSVTLTNPEGRVVPGTFSPDGKTWTANEQLGYGRTYTVAAVAGPKKFAQTFTSVAAKTVSPVSLAPLDNATVGIGQVIAFRFGGPITNRKVVEDSITVETNPKVDGAFYWISNQEVRWRPEQYWQPGTTVTVSSKFYGKNLGGGTYPSQDRTATFTIGEAVKTIIDDETKTMTVYKDGAAIKTIPVSLGKDDPKTATPNGTYVVGDQLEDIVMDSTTYGLALSDGGYRTDVKWATQLSYSGIYIHAAPWSEPQQGISNESHGCVNVSTDAGKWVYNNLKRGDVVEIKNTVGGTLSGTDGLGDWNIPWSTWKAGNAGQA